MSQRRFRPIATIVVGCLAVSLTGGLWAATPASAATQTWDTPVYGGYDWVVPSGITTATFDLSGASGAGTGGVLAVSYGGYGGKTIGTIAVTPGETLKINVGGAPPGGVNGGGYGGASSQDCSVVNLGNQQCLGAGGGGASDVRQGGTALANRVLVAGGGGGAGGHNNDYNGQSNWSPAYGGNGGAGGLLQAGAGGTGDGRRQGATDYPGGCGGAGGTQTAVTVATGEPNPGPCHQGQGFVYQGGGGGSGNTSLGNGANGLSNGTNSGSGGIGSGTGGGGGGGYVGGAGGADGYNGGGGGGGGGGSSFAAAAATNVSFSGAVNVGDGTVTVTYTSPAVAPANTSPPTITGTPVAGHTLTCNKGSWSGSAPKTYAYRWLRNGVAITGATSASYLLNSADIGKQLRCRVTASNNAGSAMATSAAGTIKTPPKNTAAPTISGTPKVGKTLTCNKGTWTGSLPITYTHQWLRNSSPIAGATAAAYVAKLADKSRFLSCRVTAHSAAGTASKASTAVKVT